MILDVRLIADGDALAVEVWEGDEQLPIFTFGRSREEAEAYAREAIAVHFDVEPGQVTFSVSP